MHLIINQFKNKIFLRFFQTYIAVLLIPLFISIQTYSFLHSKMKNLLTEFNTVQLTETMGNIDRELREIDKMTLSISSQDFVTNLMGAAQGDKNLDYLKYREAIELISKYLVRNSSFLSFDYYIYLDNSNYIMTNSSLYSPELYYNAIITKSKSNNENYKKWLSMIRDQYHSSECVYVDYEQIGYINNNKIVFLNTIPIRMDKKVKGTFIAEIEKSELQQILYDKLVVNNSYAYIEDGEGNIVVSTKEGMNRPQWVSDATQGSLVFQDKENYIATYVTSPVNGWRYITVVPEAALFHDLNNIQKLTIGVFMIMVALGLFISFVFTKRNSSPMIKINEEMEDFLVEGSESKSDPYNIITKSVSKLVSEQKQLAEDLANRKPMIKTSFINNLILGKVYDENEIVALAKYLDLAMDGDSFYVAIIKTYKDNDSSTFPDESSIEEIYVWKTLVSKEIETAFNHSCIVHDVDRRRLVFIFNLSLLGMSKEAFIQVANDKFHEVNEVLYDSHNMSVFIGIGSRCNAISELWKSYEEAELSLEYIWGDSKIEWYEQISQMDRNYFYPVEVENRILNWIRNGNYEEIEKVLQYLFKENFVKRKLSTYIRVEFFTAIRLTLNKILLQIKDEGICQRIKNFGSRREIEGNFDELKKICRDICKLNGSEKKAGLQQSMKEIQAYIANDYADSKLGLYKIASHFNFSEGYFSMFFKENMGINFADYLERVRLEKSIELLITTNRTIDSIALEVGYNSSPTYRRAFKKIYLITPNEYRTKNKNSTL